MKNNIFESMYNRSKPTRRWLFFPVSMLFHGLLIAAIVTVPLLMADSQLPEVKITRVFLTAAPPPPPPVPKGKGGGRKSTKKAKPKKEKPKPEQPQLKKFTIPDFVPEDIPEEEWEVPGVGPGGDIGEVIGAPDDWDESPRFFKTEINPNDRALRLNIKQPRLIKQVPPQYPVTAVRARIEGVVRVEAVTDIYGKVTKINVLDGHPLLRSAAVQAVKQWVYEPYIINGLPKPVMFTVKVYFKLNN